MKPTKNNYGAYQKTLQNLLVAAAVTPFLAVPAIASQLIYTPVNPSFGGSPLNGGYLLQKAQAGKKYVMPMDDLDFLDSIGIVAQTENSLIFKKGDSYYSYDINTGVLRYIDFNSAMGVGLESPLGGLE